VRDRGLIDQTSAGEVLASYLGLTSITEGRMATDIALDRLDELIIVGRDLDTNAITTVNFIPPEFPSGQAPTAAARAAVGAALQGADGEGNASLAESCAGPAEISSSAWDESETA
jgi:hypothetical protein